jgi:hypothetical protein
VLQDAFKAIRDDYRLVIAFSVMMMSPFMEQVCMLPPLVEGHVVPLRAMAAIAVSSASTLSLGHDWQAHAHPPIFRLSRTRSELLFTTAFG